jgi:hypothetical protein
MLRCLIVATIVGSTSAFTAGISPVLAGGSGSRLAGVASAPSRGAKLSALRMAAAGGAEAKGKLMKLLGEAGLGKGETEEQIREIDSLVDELSKEGTKFTRQVADGEWALVLSRNSKGSPKLQKASNKAEKVGTSFANFDCSQDKFFNIAEVFGGKGTLKATVAFGEMTDVGAHTFATQPSSHFAAHRHSSCDELGSESLTKCARRRDQRLFS